MKEAWGPSNGVWAQVAGEGGPHPQILLGKGRVVWKGSLWNFVPAIPREGLEQDDSAENLHVTRLCPQQSTKQSWVYTWQGLRLGPWSWWCHGQHLERPSCHASSVVQPKAVWDKVKLLFRLWTAIHTHKHTCVCTLTHTIMHAHTHALQGENNRMSASCTPKTDPGIFTCAIPATPCKN